MDPVRLEFRALMRFHNSGTWEYIGILRWPPSYRVYFINNTNKQQQPPFLIFSLSLSSISFVKSAIELISFPVYQQQPHRYHQHKIFSPRSTTFSFRQANSTLKATYLRTQSSPTRNHFLLDNPPLQTLPNTYHGTRRIQWPSSYHR